MKIDKSIFFFDCETTGTNTRVDRIVEFGVHLMHPIFDDATGKLTGLKRESYGARVNPGFPIPAEASAIHGIFDSDVANKPTLGQKTTNNMSNAEKLLYVMTHNAEGEFEPKDLAGFNSNKFDFPLLLTEFQRCGLTWDYTLHRFIDVSNIYRIMNPRTLSDAVKFYLETDLEGAHGAEADIKATADVFLAMLKRYHKEKDNALWTAKTMQELAVFSNYGRRMADLSGHFVWDEEGAELLFNFGEHKGKPVKSHIDYCEWMRKPKKDPSKDFPKDSLEVLAKFLA